MYYPSSTAMPFGGGEKKKKSGAPPFCLREVCCSASASLDADICSV